MSVFIGQNRNRTRVQQALFCPISRRPSTHRETVLHGLIHASGRCLLLAHLTHKPLEFGTYRSDRVGIVRVGRLTWLLEVGTLAVQAAPLAIDAPNEFLQPRPPS